MFSFIPWSDLTLPPTPTVYLLSVSLPLLALSQSNGFHAGLAVFKIISSIAFLSGPLSLSEWSPYQRLIVYGLALSFVGDILLIPSRSELYRSSGRSTSGTSVGSDPPKQDEISISFKLGVLMFAGAHVAYIIAFLKHAEDVSWSPLIGTFVATMALSKPLGVIYPGNGGASRWNNMLNLTILGEMRPLVSIYAVIIGSMLAVSAATISPGSPAFPRQRLLGAILFVVSDIFVAKDAFGNWDVPEEGKKGGIGRHWLPKVAVGYGLYFWGQMVLAGTVYE